MKHYHYYVLTADDCGVKVHPQVQMKNLGCEVIDCEPFSIGDCWVFRVKNELHDIPEYLTELSDEFLFSWERRDVPNTPNNKPNTPKEPPTHNPDGSLTDYGRCQIDPDWVPERFRHLLTKE